MAAIEAEDVVWPEEIAIDDEPELPQVARSIEPVADIAPQSPPHVAEVEQVSTLQDAPENATAESVATESTSVESLLPPVGTKLSVDHVRVSENTYAFRLRWSNPPDVTPKRPAIYYQWVHASIFDMITADKDEYGRYKKSIIAQFDQSQTI